MSTVSTYAGIIKNGQLAHLLRQRCQWTSRPMTSTRRATRSATSQDAFTAPPGTQTAPQTGLHAHCDIPQSKAACFLVPTLPRARHARLHAARLCMWLLSTMLSATERASRQQAHGTAAGEKENVLDQTMTTPMMGTVTKATRVNSRKRKRAGAVPLPQPFIIKVHLYSKSSNPTRLGNSVCRV